MTGVRRYGLTPGRDMIFCVATGVAVGGHDMDFYVAIRKPHRGLKWCCDTKSLVSRPGLGLARRSHVLTWNQCRDRGGPMRVATRPWCHDRAGMPSVRR